MNYNKPMEVKRFYERFESDLKDLGFNLTNYGKLVSKIVGKNINFTRSKGQGRFPAALAIPFIDTGCFNDDEMYLIAIEVIENTKDNDEELNNKLDSFISELELSKELKDWQRIKRQIERVIK